MVDHAHVGSAEARGEGSDPPRHKSRDRSDERRAAEALAGKVCAAAADEARASCTFLELLGEFDATQGVGWWVGVKSLAHWLSWSCSMAPGTAREHVRVARALRSMPTTLTAFREGRLSYSKVREVTRVVDLVDEAKLCELALTATASQLARTVSGFRTAQGSRLPQQAKRRVGWIKREDGMCDFPTKLPAEEAAVVIAAITAARDHHDESVPEVDAEQATETGTVTDEGTGVFTNADALLEICRHYLAGVPEDRSGEDRTTVMVHVSARALADASAASEHLSALVGGTLEAEQDASPGTTEDVAPAEPSEPHQSEDPAGSDVPAGTSVDPADQVCRIENVGGIEAATALKLACDNSLIGAIVDEHGDVLALGRTRRLVSPRQRRALMIRDRMCQYPGCSQANYLKAHHIISWLRGGLTDLDNLILLCQFHHTAVHEGNISIVTHRDGDTTGSGRAPTRFTFHLPDGDELTPLGAPAQPTPGKYTAPSDELLTYILRYRTRRNLIDTDPHNINKHDHVTDFEHPEARTIRPRWAGEQFDLHASVQALFAMGPPPGNPEEAHDMAA